MERHSQEILAVLREAHPGGFSTGDIAEKIAAKVWGGGTWAVHGDRMRSALVLNWLKQLEREGLVRRMDDLKPIAWVISEEGAAP